MPLSIVYLSLLSSLSLFSSPPLSLSLSSLSLSLSLSIILLQDHVLIYYLSAAESGFEAAQF